MCSFPKPAVASFRSLRDLYNLKPPNATPMTTNDAEIAMPTISPVLSREGWGALCDSVGMGEWVADRVELVDRVKLVDGSEVVDMVEGSEVVVLVIRDALSIAS